MSRSPPRGRLKATALVLLRVLNSPATLRNRGGWFVMKPQRLMKSLLLLVAHCVAFGLTGCDDPGPKISGYKAAYWIERLSDADRKTAFEARTKLREINSEDLRPSIKILRKSADHGIDAAIWLLFEKFDEVNVKWVDEYVGSIEALQKLDSYKTHAAILAALENMKTTGIPKNYRGKLDPDQIERNKYIAKYNLERMGCDQPDLNPDGTWKILEK